MGACQDDEAYIRIKSKEVTISEAGGEATIAFETNSSWVASSSERWCTITPSRGGQSSKSTTIKLAPNDTHDARTCELTILAGEVSETITITQLQRDAIIISNTTYELLSGSHTLKVELKANVEVEVIIEEDAQEWVSTPHTSTRALEAKTVTLHIAENKGSNTPRTAKVYIKDKDTDLHEVLTIVQQGESIVPDDVQVIMGNNSKIQHLNVEDDFVFRMSNLDNEDIYFVFTNDKNSRITLPQLVDDEQMRSKTATTRASSFSNPTFNVPGKPLVTEFNNNPPQFFEKEKTAHYPSRVASRAANLGVGASEQLNDDEGNAHPSTVRKVVSAHGKNLYVWVADDCWHDGGTKSYQVTQGMVNALANKFLAPGIDNDVYEWVTNAAGAHWGATDYDNLIADTDDIHIWLMDIDNDNKTSGTVTLGYFYARDNYRKSSIAAANELLFTIDAVLFAKPDGGRPWSLSDFWPSQMVSTLVHEFTHMIYFYQHQVLNGLNSNRAINEMTAQCMEDLLANKIEADGPRGVPYKAASAGVSRNSEGRLPLFNSYNDYTLLDWSDNEEEVLTNYSKTYALGAYLMRNYGGANFIRELIQNRYTNTRSIVEAVNANGGNVANYGELLQRFGAAYLMSNKMDSNAGYLFNKGDVWNRSAVNGITYDLGSINFYNYFPTPYIYEVLPDTQPAGSNLYFIGGSGISGEKEWYFKGVQNELKVTMVVK